MFENAFHTTPLCSPNRACILTAQYASRHGIIDNVGRDAMSHRLDNYHLAGRLSRCSSRTRPCMRLTGELRRLVAESAGL